MQSKPVDVARFALCRCVAPPEVRTDAVTGRPRLDREGREQWVVGVAVRPEGGRGSDADVIDVTCAAEPVGVSEGMAVRLVDLWASEWSVEGRSGTAWRAASVVPATAVPCRGAVIRLWFGIFVLSAQGCGGVTSARVSWWSWCLAVAGLALGALAAPASAFPLGSEESPTGIVPAQHRVDVPGHRSAAVPCVTPPGPGGRFDPSRLDPAHGGSAEAYAGDGSGFARLPHESRRLVGCEALLVVTHDAPTLDFLVRPAEGSAGRWRSPRRRHGSVSGP